MQKAKELKVEVPDADVNSTVDKQFKAIRSQLRDRSGVQVGAREGGLRHARGVPALHRRRHPSQRVASRAPRRSSARTASSCRSNVTDAEVQEAFEQQQERRCPKREPSVTCRQIIVAPQAVGRAKEPRARARPSRCSPRSSVAATSSSSPSASRRTPASQRATAATSAGTGAARWCRSSIAGSSDITRSRPGSSARSSRRAFGYHIIRVDRVKPGEVKARHILITPDDRLRRRRARAARGGQRRRDVAGRRVVRLARARSTTTSAAARRPRCSRRSRARSCPQQYQQAFAEQEAAGRRRVRRARQREHSGEGRRRADQLGGGGRGHDARRAEGADPRDGLAEAGGMRRLLDTLSKQTYVSVRLEAIVAGAAARRAGALIASRIRERSAAARRHARRPPRHRPGDRRRGARATRACARPPSCASSARAVPAFAVDDAVGRVGRRRLARRDAGRLAGRAIERAVELAHARRGRRHRHRAARQGSAARRRLRLSRPHRDARRAHRTRRSR